MLQPVVVLFRVNEKVAVALGVAVGFCKEEVKPSGPNHDHAFALLELAETVTVPVTHIGPLLVAPVDDGKGLTVAVVVYC